MFGFGSYHHEPRRLFVLTMLDVIYLQLSQIYVVVEDSRW